MHDRGLNTIKNMAWSGCTGPGVHHNDRSITLRSSFQKWCVRRICIVSPHPCLNRGPGLHQIGFRIPPVGEIEMKEVCKAHEVAPRQWEHIIVRRMRTHVAKAELSGARKQWTEAVEA